MGNKFQAVEERRGGGPVVGAVDGGGELEGEGKGVKDEAPGTQGGAALKDGPLEQPCRQK